MAGWRSGLPDEPIVTQPLRSALSGGGQFTNRNASASSQQLLHLPAGAAQPIGDAPLRQASTTEPASAAALGFEDPGEQENRDEQQGQGPSREAGGGHGGKCCGGLQGAAPAPGDLVTLYPQYTDASLAPYRVAVRRMGKLHISCLPWRGSCAGWREALSGVGGVNPEPWGADLLPLATLIP